MEEKGREGKRGEERGREGKIFLEFVQRNLNRE
jgi:hypothetical protein